MLVHHFCSLKLTKNRINLFDLHQLDVDNMRTINLDGIMGQ
jgi:hypothetical protein